MTGLVGNVKLRSETPSKTSKSFSLSTVGRDPYLSVLVLRTPTGETGSKTWTLPLTPEVLVFRGMVLLGLRLLGRTLN